MVDGRLHGDHLHLFCCVRYPAGARQEEKRLREQFGNPIERSMAIRSLVVARHLGVSEKKLRKWNRLKKRKT